MRVLVWNSRHVLFVAFLLPFLFISNLDGGDEDDENDDEEQQSHGDDDDNNKDGMKVLYYNISISIIVAFFNYLFF